MMKTISTREMRAILPQLDEVLTREGELVITRRGRPIARLLPPAPAAFRTFEDDVRRGHLHVHPLADGHLSDALALIERLQGHPLRTLDALHLAVALAAGAPVLATADRIMASAAADLCGIR